VVQSEWHDTLDSLSLGMTLKGFVIPHDTLCEKSLGVIDRAQHDRS
jgi:hypothetical protein